MKRAALAASMVALALAAGLFPARALSAAAPGEIPDPAAPAAIARSGAHRAPLETPSEIARLARPALAPAGALRSARAPRAPGPERPADRREPGRQAPGPTARLHRPLTQRSKSPARGSAATPGMGLLLRLGTGEFREVSENVSPSVSAPAFTRSGRAPPLAHESCAPARDPLACSAAHAPRPAFVRDRLPDAAPNPNAPAVAPAPYAQSLAPACAPAADVGGDETQPGRPGRSRATRTKGAGA